MIFVLFFVFTRRAWEDCGGWCWVGCISSARRLGVEFGGSGLKDIIGEG